MQVDVQDVGLVDFPDDATDQEIQDALNELFPAARREPIEIDESARLIPGISTTAGGPQLRQPGEGSFGRQIMQGLRDIPEAAGQLTEELVRPLLAPTEFEPRESVVGLTREIVPRGETITKATGIPEWLTIPASGLGRTAAGFGEFFTSPAGVVDIGAAALPGIGLIQRAKFIKDMAQGAGQSTGAISPIVEKALKNPSGITTDDAQQLAEGTADTALMLLGAGKLTSQQFSQLTGIRAPVGRFLETERTRISKDVAEMLKRSEPMDVSSTAPSPIRQIGIPQAPLTAEPFLQPGVSELASAALRESQGPRIEIPGELSALEQLRREVEPPRMELVEPTRLAERIPGGGEAPYGKVSYMRPAEAPTVRQMRPIPPGFGEEITAPSVETVRAQRLLEKRQDFLNMSDADLIRVAKKYVNDRHKSYPPGVGSGGSYEFRGHRYYRKSDLLPAVIEAFRRDQNEAKSTALESLSGGRIQKGGEPSAVQRETEKVLPTVREPAVTKEGQVQMPVSEGRAKAAEARVEPTLESDKALYQDITSRMTQLIRRGQATSPLMEVLKGELEVVKNRHGGMPPGQTSPARKTMQEQQAAMRTEMAAEIQPAVRIGGRVISDPNKGHIQMALEVGGPEAISEVSNPANQGFVYKGEFISREAASGLLGEKTPMTSERLKEIRAEKPKGGEPIEEAQRQKEVLEPEPTVEAVTPLDIQSGSPLSATESLINRLETLKFPEKGEGRLYSLPHPDAVKAIGRTAWNNAIDIAIAAVKSGKAIAEAVESALAHIRKNAAGKFDEAQARANLEFVTRAESEVQRPPPVGGQPSKVTEPTATDPNFTVTDPVTGEPAKIITEKAARAMERKVKIPAQADVETLAKQIDLFNKEIGDALESGGQFLPKDLRPEVAKGAPAEKGTVTNKQINQYFVNKLSSVRKQMEATRRKIDQQADVESQVYFDTLQKRFETAFRQVQELRRASHEALYFWNKIRAEYQEIARAAGAMPEMKRQLPILDQIWKDMREKNYPQAGKHFVDYLRMNLFTLGSWTLDFGTNLVATGARLPAWAIMDTASLISGRSPTRMFTAMHALADNMKNWNPFGKRFRLPEKIESELGTTAGGEFPGRGKEVIIDFSEILRSKPEFANRLKEIDRVLGAPVRMKRAVDSFFGRFGATAELYNRAYIEGKSRGLKGDELKQFVEEFIRTPPESALNRAIQTGKELKFNRDLTKLEERFASNIVTKLVVEAFPRWTLQFVRWGGEMLGVDPSFFKKAVTGKATPEEIVTYLTKAATGWGGVYAFNQLFYDNIDANSMEYVTEEGDRVRLAGRTPAPELFFVVALLRGEKEKAKAAMAHLSVPGAKLLSGEPAGILSPLVDTIRESIRGRYTAEMTARELTKLINDAIPGKSVLGLIRSIFDPTIREGIGAPIPGVASLLPQKINPTTGEPLAPKQRIPGTSFEIPTVGGTPFPGAVRVLNDVEEALMNHGFGLTRPRRTSIIDLPAEDVPKEMRREYEKFVGENIKTFIGEEIKLKEFQELPFEVRREILSQLMTQARQLARVDMAQKYGTSMESVESVPLNIQRMPQRLRQ